MPTAAKLAQNEELDPQRRTSTSRHFEEELRQRVVGQDEAVQALVDLYQVFFARLNSPGPPVGRRAGQNGRIPCSWTRS
jgi:ATP-dependent Clp protease ATP-binding subunit ClpA